MKTQRDYFFLLAGVLLGIGLMAGGARAQVWEEWAARYSEGNSSDFARALALDEQGNVYVTGTGSGIGLDYVTIKHNSTGVQQWVARYNGPGNNWDEAQSIAADEAGSVYVTGYSFGIRTDKDYCTIKYTSEGIEEWRARYNGPLNSADEAYAVVIDALGNAYVTGSSAGYGPPTDYATIKYNSEGIEQWVARYDGPGNSGDLARAMAVDEAGNVYITGESFVIGSQYDYATVKYDSSGVEQWVARYAGPGNAFDRAYSIAVDAFGCVYVTGSSNNAYATIKYNAQGVDQWIAFYNFPGWGGTAFALALDGNNNIYVTGASNDSLQADFATVKYNAEGSEQWVARYNGPGNWDDLAHGIDVDQSGNVYVTGESYGSGTNYDYATVMYNSDGVEQWVARYNGPGDYSDRSYAIGLDASGSVYITGSSYGRVTYSDYCTIKYTQTCFIDISITPISPPIQIPPSGGSFNFNLEISNGAQSSQTFDTWIMLQLPEGSWRGPMLGPVNLTLPGGGNITRLRTQNIPGRAPAGTYTYRGYVGDYPARWDSSSFTFEKVGSGGLGLGASNWDNTGEAFGGEATIITLNSSLIASCAPNPFNPKTVLTYQLPVASEVTLQIYDLSGRLVTELVNGVRDAGVHQVTWEASGLPSGLYFCRIEAGSFTDVIKMMLVK